jgi:hypothetical protein
MRRETSDERRDVHCFRASLSEQDFDKVGGASGREGFLRIIPSSEKYPRPFRDISRSAAILMSLLGDSGGRAHGVSSFWAAIVSSMLASPPVILN